MSTEALRKAVEYADGIFDGCDNGEWATIKQALHDQESALATHRANYDALVIRLGEVTARLEAADGLLRKCRDEMAGLPHSLGYDFTHLPELDTHLKAADHV